MITIGIDLGTTNSCVAFNDGNGSQIIETAGGDATLPSVVMEDENGALLVGKSALRRAVRDPRFVFSGVKRQLGLAFVEGEDYGPQVVAGPDGLRWYQGRTRLIAPAELLAAILATLKASAERRIGRKVDGAVIAVPAYFDNNRILATQEAGRLAGFRKVTIITEPEAAVLAYGLNRRKYQRVVVFDIGGGTFDIVVAAVGANLFKPEAKSGNDALGGIDFDRKIRERMIAEYQDRHGRDLNDAPVSLLKMDPVAESAKKDLSEQERTLVDVQNVAMDRDEMIMRDISFELDREAFDAMTAHLVAQAMDITRRTMATAERIPKEIDEVLLVGGMTRVPAVRQAVEAYFGADKLRDGVSADLVVAIGAAIKAAQIDRRLPMQMSAEELTAHAFGLETTGGEFAQVLPAGSAYGALRHVIVTTALAGQDKLPLRVLQGTELKATANAVLARYDHKVSPGEARAASVQVEFMIDENGILMVAGKDLDTGETFNILEGSK